MSYFGVNTDMPTVHVATVEAAAHEAAIADGVIQLKGYKTNEVPKRKKSNLRRGKWTPEEEIYANRLIKEFKLGTLPLTDGTTLRTFLSKLLNCDPMRISKKFVGQNCIGKQVFRQGQEDGDQLSAEQVEISRKELGDLERKFLDRVAVNTCVTADSKASKTVNGRRSCLSGPPQQWTVPAIMATNGDNSCVGPAVVNLTNEGGQSLHPYSLPPSFFHSQQQQLLPQNPRFQAPPGALYHMNKNHLAPPNMMPVPPLSATTPLSSSNSKETGVGSVAISRPPSSSSLLARSSNSPSNDGVSVTTQLVPVSYQQYLQQYQPIQSAHESNMTPTTTQQVGTNRKRKSDVVDDSTHISNSMTGSSINSGNSTTDCNSDTVARPLRRVSSLDILSSVAHAANYHSCSGQDSNGQSQWGATSTATSSNQDTPQVTQVPCWMPSSSSTNGNTSATTPAPVAMKAEVLRAVEGLPYRGSSSPLSGTYSSTTAAMACRSNNNSLLSLKGLGDSTEWPSLTGLDELSNSSNNSNIRWGRDIGSNNNREGNPSQVDGSTGNVNVNSLPSNSVTISAHGNDDSDVGVETTAVTQEVGGPVIPSQCVEQDHREISPRVLPKTHNSNTSGGTGSGTVSIPVVDVASLEGGTSKLPKNESVEDFWMLVNIGDLPQPDQDVLSNSVWPQQTQVLNPTQTQPQHLPPSAVNNGAGSGAAMHAMLLMSQARELKAQQQRNEDGNVNTPRQVEVSTGMPASDMEQIQKINKNNCEITPAMDAAMAPVLTNIDGTSINSFDNDNSNSEHTANATTDSNRTIVIGCNNETKRRDETDECSVVSDFAPSIPASEDTTKAKQDCAGSTITACTKDGQNSILTTTEKGGKKTNSGGVAVMGV